MSGRGLSRVGGRGPRRAGGIRSEGGRETEGLNQ